MSGLLFISFIAGMLTVLAPCILPLLPVIVGGSVSGEANVRRTLVIVLSLGASVLLFTLILKASTAFITIPALFWQLLSGCLLLFFGIVTLMPTLWDHIPGTQLLYRKSNKLLGSGYQQQSIWGDVVMGAALGPVFSSCSPTYFVILAAVLPAHFALGITYLLAYVCGLCLFLFVIAFLGQHVVIWLGVASDPKSWFKKCIGIIFILIGVAVIFGFDKKLEAALPAGAFGEIGIEQKLLSGNQLNPTNPVDGTASSTKAIETQKPSSVDSAVIAKKALQYKKAPELAKPDGYINTGGNPITIGEFVGKKVVLVDFWDYSCINCQRALPYVNEWYKKYKDQGLVIIGVHTPEFAFEHVQSNVQAAADKLGIAFPVVLDNEYQTWNAFQNQYWPRDYLIDIDGYIVHDHAGEGDYDKTEKAIQDALAERAKRLNTTLTPTTTVSSAPADFSAIRSPETYFGSSRNNYLGNGTVGTAGTQTFTLPSVQKANTLYLGGTWNITPEYAEAGAGARIRFAYSSHDVYFVAVNAHGPVKLKILRDGLPVGDVAGADVDAKTSEAVINGDRLYKLIHDSSAGAHTIEIQIEEGTLDAYTFTFG